MRKLAGLTFCLVLLMVAQAGASVVTSIPGGSSIPIPVIPCDAPNFACFGPGPFTFGPGVTWSSTNAFNEGGSAFGFLPQLPCPSGCYSFGANGNWVGGLGPMAGLNDSTDNDFSTDTMTFAFARPVRAVGGFLNYAPGSLNPTTIAVYDSSCDPRSSTCTPIESFDLTFATSGGNDTGAFYGFQESTANISYFTLTDNFVGITDLTIVVPEPGSFMLLGSGMLGVIGYGRRRLGR